METLKTIAVYCAALIITLLALGLAVFASYGPIALLVYWILGALGWA